MTELTAIVLVLALAWSAAGPGGLVLAVLGLAGWWLGSRLFWPWKTCPRCKGTGRNPGSSSKRHGDCRRCHGTRRVQRFGARWVHRTKLAMRGRKGRP